jgi:uncharacterized protein
MAETKLIVNVTRGRCVCVGELADRPLPRMRGLMGRPGLPAGEGLLISPAPAIHTAFMRFPIDALFLDRTLRILDIVERLRPWRFASKRGARAVLELTAGECARRGVRVGDRLELRARKPLSVECDKQGKKSAAGSTAAGSADAAGADASEADAYGPDVASVLHWSGGELARFRPLRVLVISADRRFRSVMALLLPHRGCSVTTTASAGRIAELVARERADVMLIDADQLPVSSARAVATVDGRPVGVVVVTDDASSGPHDQLVLAKWGPFVDLFAAIERADAGRGTWRDTGTPGGDRDCA